jgi:hypothetical protein
MPAIRNKSHNEMMGILSQFAMNNLGFGPVGEIRMLGKSGENSYNFYRDKINEANLHLAIAKAEEALVTKRNDVLLVTPDSHDWRGDAGATTTTLTWDKESTHMLGMSPPNLLGYNRSRFSHAGNSLAAVSMLTVSGASNIFQNIRWMHGIGQHDHTLLTLSGSGNTFKQCGFGTPMFGLQAADADFRGVVVSGSMNHFKDCMFGSTNDIDRSAANAILQFTTGSGPWNVFENCVFRSRSGGGQTTAIFIDDACTATVQDYTAIFLNCQFIHKGSGTGHLAVGITKAANTSRYLYFDSRCTFAGVDNIVTAGQEASIIWGQGGAGPDVGAAFDNKGVGLGAIVAT